MRYRSLSLLSAALLLSASVLAAPPMSKNEYGTTKAMLSTKYQTDKAACSALKGNAEDVCVEEAKASEKIAMAELEANYSPSEKHHFALRMAKADGNYEIGRAHV